MAVKPYGRNPSIPVGEEDPMLPRYTDKCRCPTCGEYFNSAAAFGRHRYGPFAPIYEPAIRQCLTVDEMKAKGWVLSETGHWKTGKRSAQAIAQRRGAAIATDPVPDSGPKL